MVKPHFRERHNCMECILNSIEKSSTRKFNPASTPKYLLAAKQCFKYCVLKIARVLTKTLALVKGISNMFYISLEKSLNKKGDHNECM